MAILTASHLKKYYGKDESLVKELDDVNVSIEEGQFAAVIGTSGSGKSTLLNMLGGLDVPTSGSVQIEGNKLEEMSEEQLTVFRRKRIGFIFQNYNLIPYLTAYENIVLPVRLDGKKEDKKFLKEIVNFLELDGKLSNYPSHLNLISDLPCAEDDLLMFTRTLINRCSELFLHTDGRAAAVDISGQGKKLFLFDHLNTLFSHTFSCFL